MVAELAEGFGVGKGLGIGDFVVTMNLVGLQTYLTVIGGGVLFAVLLGILDVS